MWSERKKYSQRIIYQHLDFRCLQGLKYLSFQKGPSREFYVTVVGGLLRLLAETKADISWSN